MSSKVALFLSTLLLAQLVYLELVEGKRDCRPGLMMCNRKNGKRQEKVSQKQVIFTK